MEKIYSSSATKKKTRKFEGVKVLEMQENQDDKVLREQFPEYKKAVELMEGLKTKFPQFNINGMNNVWIVKPAGLSRGRGITLYRSLTDMIELSKSKETQYIV